MTSVCESSGDSGRGVVGNAPVTFTRPLGVTPATTIEDTFVATTFGDEVAAFDAMLLKNESYPIW